jgi:hypothetical protein
MADGDSSMILSAAASISAEYRPSRERFRALSSSAEDVIALADFTVDVRLVVFAPAKHPTVRSNKPSGKAA